MATQKPSLIVIGITAGLMLFFGHHVERDFYRCRICSSRKDEFQLRVGIWPASIPLMPNFRRVKETRFLHDLLPPNHRHQWRFAQGSPYYFFGLVWGGCAIGGGRYGNPICEKYESDAEFRRFMQTKLHNGSLAQSNLVTLLSSAEEMDALLKTYSENKF